MVVMYAKILYRDPGLLVVSKPFAIRMDGPWDETVEKMAKEHFPGKVRFIHQVRAIPAKNTNDWKGLAAQMSSA